MLLSWWLIGWLLAALVADARDVKTGDDLFTGVVPRVQIEIPAEGMAVLRQYHQVWRQARPERIDVKATVREGASIYTNVALHLKGSYSFQPIDAKPSLTLHFDKFAPGQRFHGLTKIHLNNSVQDPSCLCEALARELFASVGVPSPRAAQALVNLNGRDLGLFVLVEAANKQFVKRHFPSSQGNLYDGGSGGDVTKAIKVDCGEHPEDRSDLTNLVQAARLPDPARRLARLEEVLDVERFISFAATEAFLVHWDGYAIGCNNYRLFHDASRDKMIFLPHGLDQLFGVSSSPTLSITPPFKGLVAKSLLAVPEARRRYLARIEQLSTNEFRTEALYRRVDHLAASVRAALATHPLLLVEFEFAVQNLKDRIAQRAASVAQQLSHPKRPLPLGPDNSVRLAGWSFKPGPTQPAAPARLTVDNREILRVLGRAPDSTGAWRTTVFLDQGHYEFTGLARTEELTAADATGSNGVILRISGERSTRGIAITDEWKKLTYEFDVRGLEDVELVCEFRAGPAGSGWFDAGSLRLVRRGPPLDRPKPRDASPVNRPGP